MPAQSPQPMEIDEVSKPSSQEKFPETAPVSEQQVSEPPMEVIDLSDIWFVNKIFLYKIS